MVFLRNNSPGTHLDFDICYVYSDGRIAIDYYDGVRASYGKIRSPCRNNNGFLDGLESYYVRNYGGTHNDYSGPESDGSDVDNDSYGRV